MHKSPEITRLIHDNFSLVLSFALSRPPLQKFLTERFQGEWKYLWKSTVEYAEIRADRALLEMATQLRVLDDTQDISGTFRNMPDFVFGEVTQADGSATKMYLRDLTNKIVHAAEFKWDIADAQNPKIICIPVDGDRWRLAVIDLWMVAGLIGLLMF